MPTATRWDGPSLAELLRIDIGLQCAEADPIGTPAELLFEVASEDRLRILALLGERPSRLTELARTLSVTDPEASRQLGRLTKAGLVAKTADGSFALTSLGRLTRILLPSFTVLAKDRGYFLSHDLSTVPEPFLRRIGELADHRILDHIDDVLRVVGEVTSEAREYVWIMADQPVHLEHKHAQPDSLSVRILMPRSFDEEVRPLLVQNWPGAKTELAYLESIPANLLLSERLACIMFRGLDGRVDFNRGIAGGSAAFLGWCRDLFDHQARAARKAFL